MAYFTAVLSPVGSVDDRDWRSVDVDLEAGSPDELGEVLRAAVEDDGAPVLAVLEREDEWFAIVRSEGDDVKVFVSDSVAAADSSFAPLFAELPAATEQATGDTDEDSEDDPEDEADDEPTVSRPAPVVAEDVWAGDPELLTDLGCPADVLVQLAGSGTDPSEATVAIGELLGFAEVVESLR